MNIVLAFDEGPGHRPRAPAAGRGSRARARRRSGFDVELHVLGGDAVVGDIVLVDSYRVRADDRSRVRADLVIAIDDIERDLAVDLVIDPDPGADARVHSTAAAVVAGAPYALVDPALHALPLRADPRGRAPGAGHHRRLRRRGTRRRGSRAGLADALPGDASPPRGRPLGSRNRRRAGRGRARARRPRAAELAAADIVVTAGGVTMLEACCLGRPVVAFSIAHGPGPRAGGRGARRRGASRSTSSSAAEVAARLANDVNARSRLATSARRAGRRSGLGARGRRHRGHGPPRRPRPLTREHEPARLVAPDLEQCVEHRQVRRRTRRRDAARYGTGANSWNTTSMSSTGNEPVVDHVVERAARAEIRTGTGAAQEVEDPRRTFAGRSRAPRTRRHSGSKPSRPATSWMNALFMSATDVERRVDPVRRSATRSAAWWSVRP